MVIPVHKYLAKKKQEHVTDTFNVEILENSELVPFQAVRV
jgi:hypothetical protein